MQVAHPDHIEATHVPVSSYSLGPYWFLKAMPKNVLVSDVDTFAWWVSYAGEWVSRGSFGTLEEAMTAAVEFSSETRAKRAQR